MSYVTLPSSAVAAAVDIALKSLARDGAEIAEGYTKYREWSWRHFRMVERERGYYEALECAKGSVSYFFWSGRRDRVTAAARDLLPICKVAETVNVSAEHFNAIAQFYKAPASAAA